MRNVGRVEPKYLAQQRGSQAGFPYTIPKHDLGLKPAYMQTNQLMLAYVALLNCRTPVVMALFNAAGATALMFTNYYYGSLQSKVFLFGTLMANLAVANLAFMAAWLVKGLLIAAFLHCLKDRWYLGECLAADAYSSVVAIPLLFVSLLLAGTPLGYYFFGAAVFAQLVLAGLNLKMLSGLSLPLAVACEMSPFILAVFIAQGLM